MKYYESGREGWLYSSVGYNKELLGALYLYTSYSFLQHLAVSVASVQFLQHLAAAASLSMFFNHTGRWLRALSHVLPLPVPSLSMSQECP